MLMCPKHTKLDLSKFYNDYTGILFVYVILGIQTVGVKEEFKLGRSVFPKKGDDALYI